MKPPTLLPSPLHAQVPMPRLPPSGFAALEAGASYRGERLLEGVNLEVNPGEVHILLGGPGSGKSALLAMVGGRLPVDQGGLFFARDHYRPGCPAEAAEAGVGLLWQRPCWDEGARVHEVFLRSGGGLWRTERHRKEVAALLASLDYRDALPLETPVGALDAAGRQRLALALLWQARPRLLLLDEPFAPFGREERLVWQERIGRLAWRGAAVIVATRQLEEALAMGHRCSVMEGGRLVGVAPVTDQSRGTLAPYVKAPAPCARLTRPLRRRRLALRLRQREAGGEPLTLTLYEGEVLGLAGVAGSGRRSLLRRVAGLEPRSHWELWRADRQVALSGMGHVLPRGSVADNVTLPRLRELGRVGLFFPEKQWMAARHWLDGVALPRVPPGREMGTLPLGEQRRVELARMLMTPSPLFLMYEPFAGLDEAARRWMRHFIDTMARGGKAVVLTGPPEELLPLCDTIAMLQLGRISAVRPADRWHPGELPR